MAEIAETMIRDSMDAFARRDEQLARDILQRDDEVDQYRDMVFQELIDEVTSETRFIQQALDLILISRNLERIADHATNIAETVVFMVLGEDIRHRYNAPSSTKETARLRHPPAGSVVTAAALSSPMPSVPRFRTLPNHPHSY